MWKCACCQDVAVSSIVMWIAVFLNKPVETGGIDSWTQARSTGSPWILSVERSAGNSYQCPVPGSPLNGPTISAVTQPP